MKQKWKGELTKDLLSLGRSEKGLPPEFKKGDTVICKKKRVYDEYSCWNGEYEFHYFQKLLHRYQVFQRLM